MTVKEGIQTVLPLTKHASDLGFDLNALELKGVAYKLFGWALDDPRWLFRLLRCLPRAGFPPWFTWFGWVIVTRFDDVQEVLAHDQVFRVPDGEKTRTLNGGPNFLLRDGRRRVLSPVPEACHARIPPGRCAIRREQHGRAAVARTTRGQSGPDRRDRGPANARRSFDLQRILRASDLQPDSVRPLDDRHEHAHLRRRGEGCAGPS